LGWVDGRTVTLEYRWVETLRFDDVLAEFVGRKVDVIFTSGTPAVSSARKATTDIPIVFAGAGDPVASGLVASLARPGGNVTGLSNQTQDVASKRVGLFREIAPGLRRLAIMVNVDNVAAASEMREVQAAASTLGIAATPLEILQAEDITPHFRMLRERTDALYVVVDSLVTIHAVQINSLALGARLPTMHGTRELVVAGGLISYGANYPNLYRRGAEYIDKILRGAKPGDIPVEQPTKFELVINLTTARVLGIEVPPALLVSASEIIE
jgi:putative ABC transport system substrate-binding protein